jgi:hypothetical protein
MTSIQFFQWSSILGFIVVMILLLTAGSSVVSLSLTLPIFHVFILGTVFIF